MRNGEKLNRPDIDHEDLHHDRLPDPTVDMLRHLTARVVALEASMQRVQLDEDPRQADAWVTVGSDI